MFGGLFLSAAYYWLVCLFHFISLGFFKTYFSSFIWFFFSFLVLDHSLLSSVNKDLKFARRTEGLFFKLFEFFSFICFDKMSYLDLVHLVKTDKACTLLYSQVWPASS